MSSVDDLYSSIGYGSVPLTQIFPKLKMLHNKKHNIEEEEIVEIKEKEGVSKAIKKSPQGVSIKGVDNIKIRFARCCNPVPGDEIIGYITRGRGVAVHRTDCPNISNSEDTERFIEVNWDTEDNASYPAEIQVKSIDRFGLLSEITKKITDADIGLMGLNARTDKDGIAFINLTLEIKTIDDLKDLKQRIMRIDGIIEIGRAHV